MRFCIVSLFSNLKYLHKKVKSNLFKLVFLNCNNFIVHCFFLINNMLTWYFLNMLKFFLFVDYNIFTLKICRNWCHVQIKEKKQDHKINKRERQNKAFYTIHIRIFYKKRRRVTSLKAGIILNKNGKERNMENNNYFQTI